MSPAGPATLPPAAPAPPVIAEPPARNRAPGTGGSQSHGLKDTRSHPARQASRIWERGEHTCAGRREQGRDGFHRTDGLSRQGQDTDPRLGAPEASLSQALPPPPTVGSTTPEGCWEVGVRGATRAGGRVADSCLTGRDDPLSPVLPSQGSLLASVATRQALANGTGARVTRDTGQGLEAPDESAEQGQTPGGLTATASQHPRPLGAAQPEPPRTAGAMWDAVGTQCVFPLEHG